MGEWGGRRGYLYSGFPSIIHPTHRCSIFTLQAVRPGPRDKTDVELNRVTHIFHSKYSISGKFSVVRVLIFLIGIQTNTGTHAPKTRKEKRHAAQPLASSRHRTTMILARHSSRPSYTADTRGNTLNERSSWFNSRSRKCSRSPLSKTSQHQRVAIGISGQTTFL